MGRFSFEFSNVAFLFFGVIFSLIGTIMLILNRDDKDKNNTLGISLTILGGLMIIVGFVFAYKKG
jgi:hypothetical protein